MARKRYAFSTAVTIGQPIDSVWEAVGDFHDLSWCPNVVSSCTRVGDASGKATGARRIVNDAFHERLRARSDYQHLIGYHVEQGPPPVSSHEVAGFLVEMRLSPVGDNATNVACNVLWAAENDDAIAFCESTYAAMLRDLRNSLE